MAAILGVKTRMFCDDVWKYRGERDEKKRNATMW
jgi:hypothetical protein